MLSVREQQKQAAEKANSQAMCFAGECGMPRKLKGAMCNKVEYLLTEMQYDIHNYVFSGV